MDGFVKAAELRNVNLNLDGFKVEFVDSLFQDACGIGVMRRNGKPPYVHISRKPRCWTYLTYYEREELIYHEFGHALLRRGHDNDTLPNGERRSIMAQGIWGLTENSAKKMYYLDELFNRNTPIPEWAF